MQNEVFNRRLFQRKDGARTRLNQLARADQPSGILASSQPLIDEAMKSVRRPETSAIPMDVAKGMSAGRADGMPMAPAPMPMPMPMAPPPAPMPMAPPPQQMAQAPQPQPKPNLNPMRPGVKTMQEGGEPLGNPIYTPKENREPTSNPLFGDMSVDISELAGTVLQAIGIIDDPDVDDTNTGKSLVVMAGGDPDKPLKAEMAKAGAKLGLSKINPKKSLPKIIKQVRGDLGKMAESEAFFGMAADKDPRAASAFGRAMGKAQGTQMALEADAQKTALANAEAERLLRLKAALTPRTSKTGFENEKTRREAVLTAAAKIFEGDQADSYQQAIEMAEASIGPMYDTVATTASGTKAPDDVLLQANQKLGEGVPREVVVQRLAENGFSAEGLS
mgnify:CR=1 FL=1